MGVDGVERMMVVDFLVPKSVGGPGRRGARIHPHDTRTARKVDGLEGALVDFDLHVLGSLEVDDARTFAVRVAGPGALLVAKTIKIGERVDQPGRSRDKDALDLLRLLRAVRTQELVRRLEQLLGDPTSENTTRRALELFPQLFGKPRSIGCVMAGRAAEPMELAATIAASTAALAQDLLDAKLI